jgi:tRNA threonylcarbamoyladenosine biosynthesis protein TsaE
MSVYHIKTKSAEETMAFAEKLGSILKKGDVLTLAGDLGAGKTTFTKGLAKGLGITRTVNSPTFTIIKEYKGRLPLYHMDVYRLEESDVDLGFEEYFSGEGVCVVEWATFIKEYLPDERLELVISHISQDEREIQLTPLGDRYGERVKEIMQ